MLGSNQDGTVVSKVRLYTIPTFIKVKHLVARVASNVFGRVWTPLLCQLVLELFVCLFLQHASRWRHVSYCCELHRLHREDMSFLRTYFFSVIL